MNYPKISVITASYNQAEYLEQTIKSIIGQLYPNLEYIIIDGGSTDDSLNVIKKYQEHISYWVSEKDNGVCHAINKGLAASTGEVMACINSDDVLHAGSLSIVAEIFSNFSSVNWLLGATTIMDEKGRFVEVSQSPNFSPLLYLTGEMPFIELESCFWRRSLWNEAGAFFDEKLKYASDFDLWIRFFQFDKLYTVNALLGAFRARSRNQLSLDRFDLYMEEVGEILKRQSWNSALLKKVKQLNRLKKLEKLIAATKLANNPTLTNRLTKYKISIMDFPLRFQFDRRSQQYKLGQK